jgi:3-oxoacyl-[acyl-carrier-protein] synthase II
MDDARLRGDGVARDRIATVVGLSKGDLGTLARAHAALSRRSGDDERIAAWRMSWPDAGAVAIARAEDLGGPSLAPVAACATGLVAALYAADLIRRGICDVALAGAGDSSFDPLVLASFRRMGILARCDGDPNRAVRPWDSARSGFLVGEGAGILVLERAAHAQARGVLPYAEFAGGAFGADAFHATNLNPDPSGLALLIESALARSGVSPADIDHVNVHGTATRANDPLECRALRRALGPSAERIACSANKAQLGHLLGAAGAVELAITCLAIRDAFVPPTLNLEEPDPACDLDGTPHTGRSRAIGAALKLSLGFGGHLAVAVLRRPQGVCRPPGLAERSDRAPERAFN